MIAVDVAALTAAVAASTLAVAAVVLSILNHRMSIEQAGRARQAEQGITAAVSRLDKLFDTLYRDALAMMKDAYGEVRGQPSARRECPAGDSGPSPGSSPPADMDQKLQAAKREILDGVSSLLARAKAERRDVETMSAELTGIIDRAIAQSLQGK